MWIGRAEAPATSPGAIGAGPDASHVGASPPGDRPRPRTPRTPPTPRAPHPPRLLAVYSHLPLQAPWARCADRLPSCSHPMEPGSARATCEWAACQKCLRTPASPPP
eukprot:scaffold5012_cov25-Tisochrysis_lutea.AAC.1